MKTKDWKIWKIWKLDTDNQLESTVLRGFWKMRKVLNWLQFAHL